MARVGSLGLGSVIGHLLGAKSGMFLFTGSIVYPTVTTGIIISRRRRALFLLVGKYLIFVFRAGLVGFL